MAKHEQKSKATNKSQAKSQPKKKKSSPVGKLALTALILCALCGGLWLGTKKLKDNRNDQQTAGSETEASPEATDAPVIETTAVPETTSRFPAAAERSTETLTVNDTTKVLARNCLLLECGADGNTVIAEHDADAQIFPASMTKMMSLITFVDLVAPEALDDTIIMDANVIAEQEAQMAYVAGFEAGEACRIKDLLYAMMLPSGADAAVMLATYASGSEAAFAEEMNRLAAEMGLEQSHFVNCTGLHDDNHVSSVSDMARILQFAMNEPTCREVMSTLQYTTASTVEHPEGITLTSTTLSRMVGNELEGLADPLHVRGGKTGFTNPAGQCLATWAESDSGKTYICVVAGSTTFEPLDAVGDVLTLYQLTSIPLENIQRITEDEANLPLYEHY
ncbi:MAG: D-alanyl-D-alanine carboxypeptidase [Oscillospiraceae bacterium]|nr:D-alanyl-D-alanine carboxypeptidase [Oscillospiraceae bacterium]